MDELQTIIMKRINTMDLDMFCEAVNELKNYDITFYNRRGKFEYEKFQKDCNIKAKKLFDNENKKSNKTYYCLDNFIYILQSIVGRRNVVKFLS